MLMLTASFVVLTELLGFVFAVFQWEEHSPTLKIKRTVWLLEQHPKQDYCGNNFEKMSVIISMQPPFCCSILGIELQPQN